MYNSLVRFYYILYLIYIYIYLYYLLAHTFSKIALTFLASKYSIFKCSDLDLKKCCPSAAYKVSTRLNLQDLTLHLILCGCKNIAF